MAAADKSLKTIVGTAGVLFLGVFILFLGMMTSGTPIPAEEDLKSVAGTPVVISTREKVLSGQVTSLEFTLGGQTLNYSAGAPNFSKMKDYLMQGAAMKIWFAPATTISGPSSSNMVIYKIVVGDDEVLSYADGVSRQRFGNHLMIYVGLGFLAMGGFMTYRVVRAFMDGDTGPAVSTNSKGNGKIDMSKIKLKRDE
jgi:hypothetical protein